MKDTGLPFLGLAIGLIFGLVANGRVFGHPAPDLIVLTIIGAFIGGKLEGSINDREAERSRTERRIEELEREVAKKNEESRPEE